MFSLLNLLILMLCALLGIAFFTLMERKLLSLSQNRKGPNKTAITGILQPVSDAMKLITKEINLNQKSNFSMFMISPCLNLTCSLVLWLIFPWLFEFNVMKMSILFLMSCMTMNMISLMAMSWSSNSNYAFIGLMRTISQMVSYEINLILILLTIINLTSQMSFSTTGHVQKYIPMGVMLLPLLILWVMVILAETNRTPFDFSEGESELISGFNIEYSSKSFVFLFLSEYSSILVMSIITTLTFSGASMALPVFYLAYLMMCFFFIWTRATLPRFRYDKLMKLNWTQMLPINTYILMWSFAFKMYCAMKS
uniref:NADH-ubiquinone oxidoreductase chain 1 n=1 Tax=Tetraleurodes mori TaxID=267836 RepID=Q6JCQ6_TETMO|nr:NADH dehydrogenase subunit 1 [Tetraleurodes mori]